MTRHRQSLRLRMWRRTGPELRAVYWIFWFLLQIILWAWRAGGWISTNYVLRDRKLRWIASSPRFYWLPQWQAIVLARKLANRRANDNRLRCEHCGHIGAPQYHCDHVYPRSTHPELALSYDETQMLCASCNQSKGNRWIGRGRKWRRNPRLAA